MKHRSTLTLAAAMAATMLAGCKDDQSQPPSDADAPPEKRSIFRPEFQVIHDIVHYSFESIA